MKRLLVIRFSALGDVAMLAPIVRNAAEQNPGVEITVLSQQRMADLFVGMPDNVVFYGVDVRKQSLREIVAVLGQFDAVADMHGVWRSLYIRTAMRLREAHVATIRKDRIARFLLTHHLSRTPLRHMSLRYYDVLRRLGFVSQDTDEIPTRYRQNKKGELIGIAPFAAHRGKIYPVEHMEEVVKLLSQAGEKVVLFGGGKKEKEILESWAVKYHGVESIAGKYSLAEELDIMRGLKVMVSMDSANMHLASLAGTRVVSIWGATHPYAGFLGIGQRIEDCVQRDLRCRPCSVYGNKKCKYGDYRCMEIAPEEIVEKVKSENCH